MERRRQWWHVLGEMPIFIKWKITAAIATSLLVEKLLFFLLFFSPFSTTLFPHLTSTTLSSHIHTTFWRNFPTSSQLYYSTPHLPSRLSYSVLCMFHIKLICFFLSRKTIPCQCYYIHMYIVYVEVGNICFKHFAMSFMFLCLGFLG